MGYFENKMNFDNADEKSDVEALDPTRPRTKVDEWTVRMGDQAHVHIEHYFPKGYDPYAEPWRSIRQHHTEQLAAARQEGIDWADKQYYGVSGQKRIRDLEQQVADRKSANDALRAENRGLFAKCQALEEANKKFEVVILEGEEAVDAALREQLKVEKEKSRTLVAALDEIATTGADTLDGYEAANIATSALARWNSGIKTLLGSEQLPRKEDE